MRCCAPSGLTLKQTDPGGRCSRVGHGMLRGVVQLRRKRGSVSSSALMESGRFENSSCPQITIVMLSMTRLPSHDATDSVVTAAVGCSCHSLPERKEGQLRCIDTASSPPFSVQIALVAVRHPSPDFPARATGMFRSNSAAVRDEAANTIK
jgi:hypothetical protein